MRIALDATRINVPDGGGRYTNEVLKYLCELNPKDQFFAIGPSPVREHNYPNLKFISYRVVDGLPTRLAYVFDVFKILKRHKIKIFHNLTNYGIYNSPCPIVTTVHDLLTIKFPDLRPSRLHWWLYKYYIASLLRKSHKIIAVSECTKRDLKDLYQLTDNVEVVYEGYNQKIFNTKSSNDKVILEKYNINPRYLLFVGYLTPKKNLETILKSLLLLKHKYNFRPRLVIAGKRGYGADKFFQLIGDMLLNDQIFEIGFVPDTDLRAIYRQATAFVFPSIYEGFGLPVLEAMACGTPVIVSNTGSLTELVNNNEYICSPTSADQWAEKIFKIFKDRSYFETARMHFITRSQNFSWEKCAKQIMRIYSEVLYM